MLCERLNLKGDIVTEWLMECERREDGGEHVKGKPEEIGREVLMEKGVEGIKGL